MQIQCPFLVIKYLQRNILYALFHKLKNRGVILAQLVKASAGQASS